MRGAKEEIKDRILLRLKKSRFLNHLSFFNRSEEEQEEQIGW